MKKKKKKESLKNDFFCLKRNYQIKKGMRQPKKPKKKKTLQTRKCCNKEEVNCVE